MGRGNTYTNDTLPETHIFVLKMDGLVQMIHFLLGQFRPTFRCENVSFREGYQILKNRQGQPVMRGFEISIPGGSERCGAKMVLATFS